jgi:hypothetical protein
MKARKKFVKSAVANWTSLNEALSEMTKEDVLFALELENERAEPRKSFLKRLTQRYNGIAAEEVRRELDEVSSD